VEHYHARLEWKLPEEMEIVKSFCDGKSFEFENSAELPVFEHFVAIYAERKNQNVR
jgi:hypothetical protein